MKTILLFAIMAVSTQVFAQTDKTLVFCDHNASPQENSLFMDMYFDLDATTNSYHNIEIGFLNPENTGYPDYLYTITSTPSVAPNMVTVALGKNENTLVFDMSTTGTQVINGTETITYDITVTDSKVNSFEMTATGTMNGITYTDALFTCYDPSLLNENAQPQTVR